MAKRRSVADICVGVIFLSLVGLLLLPRLVLAHAELVTAVPAPGAVLDQAPAEIRLTFSEEIGEGSDLFLFTEGFQYIDAIAPQVDAENGSQLFTPIGELEPNDYTVQWTALSVDGHAISGTYTFRVETAVTSSRPTWWLLIGGIILLGAGLHLTIRQRQL